MEKSNNANKKTPVKKTKFHDDQIGIQSAWRKTYIENQDKVLYRGKLYDHIIPKDCWEESLWSGIKTELPQYLKDKKIQPHSAKNNLISSWIVSANLYFPIHKNEALKRLMLEFLKQKISSDIVKISDVELEFAFTDNNSPLNPKKLLGEKNGNRGVGQTSPDVAFEVETKTGKGIILTECKFTESSFYSCSARRTGKKVKQPVNPNPSRCMHDSVNFDYKSICHQSVWDRKYWNYLNLKSLEKPLSRCPAATAGYQLFRQQALAEGIMQKGDYALVVSSVAFDDRNETLKGCLKQTGIKDFQTGWGDLFDGKSEFKTWTHQEWVQFVRIHQEKDEFDKWLNYLKIRYDY